MKRQWLRLATLFVVGVGAWVGLAAREDRETLPDDLARVPAKARGVFSVRVADLWASDLGKEFRKAFGKDLEKTVQHVRDTVGLAPEDIERLTAASTDLLAPETGAVLILRTSKK